MSDIQSKIKEVITNNPIVVFMKGSPEAPMCGFSAQAINVLKQAGAQNIVGINVLADPEIRQGIKDYSNWPTIPQIFIKGEFLGGCDIVTQMYESGELKDAIA